MFISFSPYYSGLSNVIMSYELAFSISYLTNRTLILPKDCFVLFVSTPTPDHNDPSNNKKGFVDIFSLFDKSLIKQEFDIIDIEHITELQNSNIASSRSYTKNINSCVNDVFNPVTEIGVHTVLASRHEVFLDTKNPITDIEDFKNFSTDRRTVDLNRPEKFIHFENNLFGHYWYHIYPGGPAQRNDLKNKINKIFKYNSKIYDIAAIVYKHIGPYNAVHIRRNDFTWVRENDLKPIDSGEKILNELRSLFDNNVPLYISTDETNKDFFTEIKKEYKIFFFEDFSFPEILPLEKIAIEQTICSQAEIFYGTFLSTYSKRINIMRGLDGKQVADYMGINRKYNKSNEEHKPFPWNKPFYPKWNWNDSSIFQWTKE